MICGALGGIAFYLVLGQSIILGLLGSFFIGALVSTLFAILVVVFRTNQVVTGITFVFLGSGLTGLVGPPFTDKAVKGIDGIYIPFFSDLPFFGRVLLFA